MVNLVTINEKQQEGYAAPCHVAKCRNAGRYQLYESIGVDGLPDWEGKAICSWHLVEEARRRPEIFMSLIDILIDALEANHLFNTPPAPVNSVVRTIRR